MLVAGVLAKLMKIPPTSKIFIAWAAFKTKETELCMRQLEIIVAVGNDGAIGREGSLIWRIPADLRRFKKMTMGHPLIMGRKTWESLPKRPLPGRLNIVVTRDAGYDAPGAVVAVSPLEALAVAGEREPGVTPFVIGGEQIYREMFPLASALDLTLVDASCPDADARFPWPLGQEWRLVEESPSESTDEGISYRFLRYEKDIDNK